MFMRELRNNSVKMSNSFKSYVGIEDYDLQSLNVSGDDSFSDLNPRLLTGEMVIAEAQKVLLFAPVSRNNQGKSGTLSVTNFKLTFVTTEERSKDEVISQQNCLLAENDICLSNIDVIYQIVGEKRRRLFPGSTVPEKVKGLCVLCKNMRIMQFSFKFSPRGHGKNITTALLHHAFPRRHHLLFAYEYSEPYYNCLQDACWFRFEHDWKNELERSGCSGWRISAANESFHLSTSLPQWLVVPVTVTDWQLSDAARHFRANRPPVWVWGTNQGAALVRMADLLPSITERTQENTMLEHVRKSHPTRRQPLLLDLAKELPSPRDLQGSFLRLRDLCAPDSLRQFQIQEKDFLTQLENSRWLHVVSGCLRKSLEAAEAMHNGRTVVLQEGDGRDMCCVVASLVQLLLEPSWRTSAGFRLLVHKEWIVMGHPFCTRLGHVYRPECEQSPVFLVFLDCVWQLTQQFPTAFEFTETFLTTLWDSAHVSIFDTFLFDCERDRLLAVMEPHRLVLRSVWDWGEQFPESKDVALFVNPLFAGAERERELLLPRWALSDLSLWAQCFLRWIPVLEIRGGGYPQVDLRVRALALEVAGLRGRLRCAGGGGGGGGGGRLPRAEAEAEAEAEAKLAVHVEAPAALGSFFPFGRSGGGAGAAPSPHLLSSSFHLNASFLLAGDSDDALLDSQSLLNAPD